MAFLTKAILRAEGVAGAVQVEPGRHSQQRETIRTVSRPPRSERRLVTPAAETPRRTCTKLSLSRRELDQNDNRREVVPVHRLKSMCQRANPRRAKQPCNSRNTQTFVKARSPLAKEAPQLRQNLRERESILLAKLEHGQSSRTTPQPRESGGGRGERP